MWAVVLRQDSTLLLRRKASCSKSSLYVRPSQPAVVTRAQGLGGDLAGGSGRGTGQRPSYRMLEM